MTKVFTIATMPQELAQAWLQHLRDFDVAHPGCHFEVGVEPPPDVTIAEAVEALQVDPALTFTQVFERARPQQPDMNRAIEAAKSVESYLGHHEGGEIWDESRFVRETLEFFERKKKGP